MQNQVQSSCNGLGPALILAGGTYAALWGFSFGLGLFLRVTGESAHQKGTFKEFLVENCKSSAIMAGYLSVLAIAGIGVGASHQEQIKRTQSFKKENTTN